MMDTQTSCKQQVKCQLTPCGPYLHQKQKRRSGWDSSAAGQTHVEPFARCVCRSAPGESSCRSAGPSYGHVPVESCWWSEEAERKKKTVKKIWIWNPLKRAWIIQIIRQNKKYSKGCQCFWGDSLIITNITLCSAGLLLNENASINKGERRKRDVSTVCVYLSVYLHEYVRCLYTVWVCLTRCLSTKWECV